MKITQEPTYAPVTILLETPAEADALFGIVTDTLDEPAAALKEELSDWFSGEYR